MFCSLFGITIPFSPEMLAELYRTHGGFVAKWAQATDSAVTAGFVVPEDAEYLKSVGGMSGILAKM